MIWLLTTPQLSQCVIWSRNYSLHEMPTNTTYNTKKTITQKEIMYWQKSKIYVKMYMMTWLQSTIRTFLWKYHSKTFHWQSIWHVQHVGLYRIMTCYNILVKPSVWKVDEVKAQQACCFSKTYWRSVCALAEGYWGKNHY